MRLKHLRLRNFRNFGDEEVVFGPRFTVLHGHNGAGKTNVLEALWFTSTLRSFRGADLKTLLRRGERAGRIEVRAHDTSLGLDTTLAVRIERGERSTRRTASADGKTIRSAAEFYGRLPSVLFTPEDLNVLRGSPGGRRRFVDRILFARERAHIGDVQAYEKLVRSRNQVLKDRGVPDRTTLLETYERGIAEVGARLWTRRVTLIDDLRDAFAVAFAQIHDTGAQSLSPAVRYAARFGEAPAPEERQNALEEALRARRSHDEQRGTTGVGPHLDDLVVELDGEPAADFASQGQTRALVLAFKIAELRDVRARTGQPPSLLLDDVSSELDPGRNAQLFTTLSEEVGQCVLTTTAAEFIRLAPGTDRCDVPVEGGRIGANSALRSSPEKPSNSDD